MSESLGSNTGPNVSFVGATAVEAILLTNPDAVFQSPLKNGDDDVTYTAPTGDK